jgi:plastocyanin
VHRRSLLLAIVLVVLAACRDGGGGGASPSSSPPPPSPSPGCAPTTTNVIRAVSLSFDRDCMAVPAGSPSTIDFSNDDAGESHNVAIYPAGSCLGKAVAANEEPRCQDPTGPAVYRGSVILGVARITYDVPALPRGAYVFVCEVHLFMHGAFRVR